MKVNYRFTLRAALLATLVLVVTFASSRLQADSGSCGGTTVNLPFTDVGASPFFCQIAEAFFSGLSNGTSATTYAPAANVTREQMAAFITRTMDQSLKRGSQRAALNQFWTPTSTDGLGLTTVGPAGLVASDGADLWVTNVNTVSRVRASDGRLLETWTGATGAFGVIAAKGRIFVTGNTSPGSLYQIVPTQPAGPVTTLSNSLGSSPQGISFDGSRIWTANNGGSVSIVTLNPLSVTTVTAGFTQLAGILYDGANMWVTDFAANKLFKLDSSGAIIQTVTVGSLPAFPVFDGTNIWVPNANALIQEDSVTVVRASTGAVVATLHQNGSSGLNAAAFDGERVLVTNQNSSNVSLWKAANLSPLGNVSVGSGAVPFGVCSDGLNFWITLRGPGQLARF